MGSSLYDMTKHLTLMPIRRGIRVLRGKRFRLQEDGEREAEFYDEVFRHEDEYNVHYTQSRYYYVWCVLVDRIMSSGAKSVLDIGCGPGQLASFFRDRGLPKYFGLDLSPVAIEKARALCPGYQFRAENALETKVLSQVDYDTVISLEFLEHVHEELGVLEQIRSGTRFLGTVPDFPYQSHVRHFNSCQQVESRYGHLFNSFSVTEFVDPSRKKRYFLLDGIRK
jgi:SAM-dependent methyltransferase